MDALEKALAGEERLTPSSGFHARVMDAVVAERDMPPALPFPWGRFAAGVAACIVWAMAAAVVAERADWSVFAPVVAIVVNNPPVVYAVEASLGSLAVVAFLRLRVMSDS